MIVTFSSQAGRDLRTLARSISLHNVKASERLVHELLKSIDRLRDFPELGANLDGHPTARRLVFGKYLVIYAVRPDRVQVLRIVHGARDLKALLHHELPAQSD